MQAGQHGNGDAGVAEARREVDREVALEARQLADSRHAGEAAGQQGGAQHRGADRTAGDGGSLRIAADRADLEAPAREARSEEHTSELQSLMRISYAVFCLNKHNVNTKQPY